MDLEARRVIVWDRKTGNIVSFLLHSSRVLLTPSQVLDVQSTDWSEPKVNLTAEVVFLDEFRIAVLPNPGGELVVFDTLIPQHHLGNMQRLELPPLFHNQRVYLSVDHDRHLGRLSRDEALIGDPSQGVFVVCLKGSWGPKNLLAVRTQILVEQKYPVHAGSRVPWDTWGRHASTMEIPKKGIRPYTFVHGAQVMLVRTAFPHGSGQAKPWTYCVDTFDFSRRGSLRLLGGAIGGERKAAFEGRISLEFKSEGGMNGPLRDLNLLSDGTLFCLVSGFLPAVMS